MFEHEKKKDFISLTACLNDYEFRQLFNALFRNETEQSVIECISKKVNPYHLAILLNDTVFCTKLFDINQEGLKRKILLSQEDIINENPNSKTDCGDDWI